MAGRGLRCSTRAQALDNAARWLVLLFTLERFTRPMLPGGGRTCLRQLVAALSAMVTHRPHESETLNHHYAPPAAACQPRVSSILSGGLVHRTPLYHPRVILPEAGLGSVGGGAAAVSGVELVLEPVERGLVDSGGRFDDGPRDAASQESLDGLHLAA